MSPKYLNRIDKIGYGHLNSMMDALLPLGQYLCNGVLSMLNHMVHGVQLLVDQSNE